MLVPGPRGNIYDRDGRLLVGNRSRFAVTLYLDELRREFRTEYIEVVRRYRESEAEGDITRSDRPSPGQLEQIARAQVVQRYLDQINRLLGRDEKVDMRELNRHFQQQLLLPYILLDDLKPEEFARLIERLPVESPLQVYTSSIRYLSLWLRRRACARLRRHQRRDVGGGHERARISRPTRSRAPSAATDSNCGSTPCSRAKPAARSTGSIRPAFASMRRSEKHAPRQGERLDISLDIDLQTGRREGDAANRRLSRARRSRSTCAPARCSCSRASPTTT